VAVGRFAAARLVGRGEALAACTAVIDGAPRHGGCLVVAGEAGIGKSALVRHLVTTARAAGWTVLPARFREGLDLPADALTQLCAAALGAGADPDHPHLGGLGPSLAPLLGGPHRDVTVAGGTPPAVVAEALARLVEVCPARRGRMVVLEDVQWADRDHLAVIDSWVDRMRTAGCALVAVVRAGEAAVLDDMVERWAGARRAHVEHLGRLAPAAIGELVADCLREEGPPELLEDVAAFSAGNPFLIEELLGELAAAAQLVATGAGWRYRRRLPLPVPGGFRTVVARRLGRLDEPTRRVARVAAIAGRQIDEDLVAVALGVGCGAVRESLDALFEAQLVSRDSTGWRFRHALSAAAVSESSAPGAHRTLAAEALDRLERAGTAEPDRARLVALARFAEAAGQRHRAAALLVQLGARAVRRGTLAGAVQVLARAERLADGNRELVTGARRMRVRALALTGQIGAALELGAQLLEEQRLAGHLTPDLELRSAMARVALADGRFEDAARLLEPLLEPGGVAAGRDASDIAALAAGARAGLGRTAEARALALAVLARPDAEPSARCEAQLVLGRLARTSDLAETEQRFAAAAAEASGAGLVLWAAMAGHELATVGQIRRLEVDALQAAFELALEAGAFALASSIEFHVAAIHGLRFDEELALSWAEANARRWRHLGSPRQQAMAHVLIGIAHAVGGRRAAARRAGEAALALAPDDAEVAGLVHGACLGLASLLGDDWPAATAELATAQACLAAVPLTGPLPPRWMAPLVAAVAGGTTVDGSDASSRASLGLFPGARGFLELTDAVVLGRHGESDLAAQAAARAQESMGQLGPAFDGFRHLALWLVSEAAHDGGWGEPSRWLVDAERFFGARGLPDAAAGCRRAMSRIGIPARRRPRASGGVPSALARYGITAREADVARLVVRGAANAEIATALHVSLRTVKTHVEHLLTRTGTSNRTQLAALLGPLLR
jgi:DNA-binding CsgD family transcriptional regulator